jgi:hypothetical protein
LRDPEKKFSIPIKIKKNEVTRREKIFHAEKRFSSSIEKDKGSYYFMETNFYFIPLEEIVEFLNAQEELNYKDFCEKCGFSMKTL